jgi:hypothetical protein
VNAPFPTLTLHHDGLSRPLKRPLLRVLSLGAGVQSSTLALMAARGEIDPPDCAVFADTQSEPAAVYRWLDWLETQLPFPVHRVTAGSLHQEVVGAAEGANGAWARPPFFIRNPDGSVGMMNRQCTQDYKLEPILKHVRGMIGLRPRQSVRHFLKLKKGEPVPALTEQWIGISTDEIIRLKRSHVAYIHNRHPLVEARMSRRDCLRWMEERQYPRPPKSACFFCPYHTNAMWRQMRDDDPTSWAEAVRLDHLLRAGRLRAWRGQAYLHRSGVPLDEADLAAPDLPLAGFLGECEGMCGV